MGRIGDSAKRIPKTGGMFVRFADGDKPRFRIIEEPWVRITQYGKDEPKYEYLFIVWDYALERVRILAQGEGGSREIDDMQDAWGEEYPSKFDLTVKATGAGKNGRKYTRTASPHLGTMPPSSQLVLPDMEEVSPKAIRLDEFLAGQDPEIETRERREEEAPEPEVEHEVRPDGRSGDVIIKDLDTENPVNLDDIPF